MDGGLGFLWTMGAWLLTVQLLGQTQGAGTHLRTHSFASALRAAAPGTCFSGIS